MLKDQPAKSSKQVFQKVKSSQSDHDLVHRPVSLIWGPELASGTAVFVDDMRPLYGEIDLVLIRSTKAHAKLKKVDFSQALQSAGIVGSLSASDLNPEQNKWGLMIPDEEVFASEMVLYHGQIIGALACTDKSLGKAAVDKVKIEYQELPFVLNLKHATDHLKLNLDDLDYFLQEEIIERHQEEEAVKLDQTIDLQGTLRVPGVEHFYMEPQSVIAHPIGEKNELVVYHSTQEVTPTQKRIAHTVGRRAD